MTIDNKIYTDPCFVFGCVLDGKGGATPLEQAESIDQPHWMHIDYSAASAESWLLQRGLSPVVVESLTRSDTRPRALGIGNGILIVLRGVNLNPGADPEDMVSLRIWIEQGRIISVRQRRLLSAQDIYQSLIEKQGAETLNGLLTDLIERIADRIATYVDSIEDSVVDYETSVDEEKAGKIRHDVSVLRRQIAAVRRYLAPQRDALDTLFRHSKEILDDEHSYRIREQSDRIMRYVEDLDLARERTMMIQEELINMIAQQQNSRMYLMSIVAAIFLPITFISGVFGMNVAGLPGTEGETAFMVVSIIMLAAIALILGLLKRKRWL